MQEIETYKESIIQEKTFKFSLLIIELYKQLSKIDTNPILRQLLRSATSIGANVNEASAGQTKITQKKWCNKSTINVRSTGNNDQFRVANIGTIV